MKMVLKQIVLLVLIASYNLNAKDIPIAQDWELELPTNEFNILEFPFKIHPRSTKFKTTKKEVIKDGVVEEDNLFITPEPEKKSKEENVNKKLALPKASKTANKDINRTNPKQHIRQSSKSASLVVKKGIKTLELFAKKAGTIKFVIWGYEQYPIMIKLKFSDGLKETENFYHFIDTSIKKEDATHFESSPHEIVLSRLTYALFNKKIPNGYRRIVGKQEFQYPKKGMNLRLIFSYVGDKYVGEYWEITNTKDSILKLDETSFYNDGIYAVSIFQNQVSAGGTTPLYLIRKAN